MSCGTEQKQSISAIIPNKVTLDPILNTTGINKLNQDNNSVQDKDKDKDKQSDPSALHIRIIQTLTQSNAIPGLGSGSGSEPNKDLNSNTPLTVIPSPHLKEEDILLTTPKIPLTKDLSKDKDQPDSTAICRVCFEPSSKLKPLISPCICSYSSKYIHQDCLNQWLESLEIWKSDQFPKCELCKFKFEAIFYFKKIVSKEKCSKVTKQLVFSAIILIFLCAAISVTIFTIVHAIKKYDEQSKMTFAEGLIIGSFVIIIVLLIANYCRIKKKMYDNELIRWRILNYSETIEFAELDKTNNSIGKVAQKANYPFVFFKNYEIVT